MGRRFDGSLTSGIRGLKKGEIQERNEPVGAHVHSPRLGVEATFIPGGKWRFLLLRFYGFAVERSKRENDAFLLRKVLRLFERRHFTTQGLLWTYRYAHSVIINT